MNWLVNLTNLKEENFPFLVFLCIMHLVMLHKKFELINNYLCQVVMNLVIIILRNCKKREREGLK